MTISFNAALIAALTLVLVLGLGIAGYKIVSEQKATEWCQEHGFTATKLHRSYPICIEPDTNRLVEPWSR